MQSMRSELHETIRHRLENAMTNVSRETQILQTELTKRIEKNTSGITDSRSVSRRSDKETAGRINRNKRCEVSLHRGLLSSNERCGSARDGTARHGEDSVPLLLSSVYSVVRLSAVGYLATLFCLIQQRVDLSQYNITKA
jgi:hypothetical protein